MEKASGDAPAAFVLPTNPSTTEDIAMSYRTRVSDSFARLSADQLVTMAGGVIAGLTNNPAFPDPTVDLKTVEIAVNDLNAALAAQAIGGTAATAEKNNKQEALIAILRRLKHYVQDNCRNDLAILLSSGFQAVATNRVRAPLAYPSILSVDPGNSRELVLRANRIANAKCYEVRSAAMNADGGSGPWQTMGLFTGSRSMKIAGLVPGTTYSFQVRAIGGSTGYSDWSNTVCRICW
jgi:hypothetical protein